MQKNKMVSNNEEKQLVTDCYSYLRHVSEKIYENERRREESVLKRARQMQIVILLVDIVLCLAHTAGKNIAFFAAGVPKYVVIQVVLLSLTSLFFATIAQCNKKRFDFADVSDFQKKVEDEYTMFSSSASRNKHLVQNYGIIQKSLRLNNDKRILYLRISMLAFYALLGLCALTSLCRLFY